MYTSTGLLGVIRHALGYILMQGGSLVLGFFIWKLTRLHLVSLLNGNFSRWSYLFFSEFSESGNCDS